MSKFIEVEALTSCLNILADKMTDAGAIVLGQAVTIAESLPHIDIVRCKECKYNPKDIGWVCCPMTGANTRKPDDFCSYGERSE